MFEVMLVVRAADFQVRHLRPARYGCRLAQRVTREKPADIHLARGHRVEMVVVVAGHEVPLLTEVMVQPDYTKIVLLRRKHIRAKALHVECVATR